MSFLDAFKSDRKVMIAGDWHGKAEFANNKINLAAKNKINLILHLGDFNLWPGPRGKLFLNKLEQRLSQHNITIAVTPGNHEDWDRLNTLWSNPKRRNSLGELQPLQLSPHIYFLPKGYRFELYNRSFVSFGGAASVDFDNRSRGKNWWPGEMISDQDVANILGTGMTDILLTHESPETPYAVEINQLIIENNPQGFTDEGLAYSKLSRKRITQALLEVKPKLMFHGHFHQYGTKTVLLPGSQHKTQIFSIPDETHTLNTIILNLETMKKS